MTKYREFFQNMLREEKDFFEKFRAVHDEYATNPEKNQKKFNEIGRKAMRIIKDWESRLCNHSEGAGYASFSGNLAQKFQDEVRRMFPKIDCVGIISQRPGFNIKKINL